MGQISFNTSHVPIYRKRVTTQFQHFLVSIHPMFLFIGNTVNRICPYFSFQYIPCSYLSLSINSFVKNSVLFQYIPCSYLSVMSLYGIMVINRFNTSHVPIYLIYLRILFLKKCCFNTSHVPIYREFHPIRKPSKRRFNTSHVPIYRDGMSEAKRKALFQYIPCSYLSGETKENNKGSLSFNTSHVPIYLMVFLKMELL